jgi:(1->4)-alpha-D-glucan 1-alpha-D-glucosylmutase
VDPDNRRPVDYNKRIDLLHQIKAQEREGSASLFSFLSAHHEEGAEKLFVTWKALNFRKQYEMIFKEGSYNPLPATGSDPAVCSFVRSYRDQHIIIAVPLGVARKSEKGEENEESIILPEHFPTKWTNQFTGKIHNASEIGLSIQEIFADFPVAILTP